MVSSTKPKTRRLQHLHAKMISHIMIYAVAMTAVFFAPTIQFSFHKFEAEAFTISRFAPQRSILGPTHSIDSLHRLAAAEERQAVSGEALCSTNDDFGDADVLSAVRAPLKFIGPYPCMALRFPNLATESQRSRNQTGISLDFVLDTAANINTLQGQVAQELQLKVLEDSSALPGVSSSGPIGGGETYILGDSELEGAQVLGETTTDSGSKPFEFMQNLTAAALPVVNPGSAGLLGLAFFYCFEGGVEFQWGGSASMPPQQGNDQRLVDGMVVQPNLSDQSSPSITFYGKDNDAQLQNSLSDLTRVSIDPIPLTQLPSVQLKVNGVEMVALLDTGSPITVLNKQAAKAAGIQTTKESLEASSSQDNSGGWNPFAGVVDKFKEAQATAEAASKGEILMIGGMDGKPTTLYRSMGATGPSISLVASSGEDVTLGSRGTNKVYVGDIPGLAALNGIGVDSPPAVVLGLDVLRQRPKMVFRPRENEFYV